MLKILDEKVGLHECIKINCKPSTSILCMYEAAYYIEDGNKRIAQAFGKTILEALQNLEREIICQKKIC